MKSLIILLLTVTSLQSYAQEHNDNPYKEIIRLQNQIQELKEANTKYSFCVKGLSDDVIAYGGSMMSRGMYSMVASMAANAKSSEREADMVMKNIVNRCISLPGFLNK